MITLLKNIACFTPQYIGKRDILIAGKKIYKITEPNRINEKNTLIRTVIPCDGLLAFPGIIDQHVHIIGGGGEDGFTSRIPEITFEDIIQSGVTTLVGVLGVDSCTRSLGSLLAKARALEEQGLTTYIYTGSYAVPTVTLTDSVRNDIVLIDKIIGTGEIAISDHRSSVPLLSELLKLSSETHLGGLLSRKAGVVHIHIGEGKQGIQPILQILKNSELPIEQFVPTHVNRTKNLFRQAAQYCKNGGNIDLTAGESVGLPVPNAIQVLIGNGIPLSKVTISSDANGSIPNNGVGKIQALYDDIKSCIINKKITPDRAFYFVTKNVAEVLKLYPQKGALMEGSDADILIVDRNYQIQKLFCMGKLRLDNGRPVSDPIQS